MLVSVPSTIEKDGFALRAEIVDDETSPPPWENDGHGPVYNWTLRGPLPGELVLNRYGNYRRYYDLDAAIEISLRDNWGPGGALADFQRLKDWCDNKWTYVGVVVTASKADIDLGNASLWGIESDATDYLVEVVNDLINDAIDEAKKKLRELGVPS
jgi:hypothetical protein